MIKRINLVEKKALNFTYLKLLQICVVIIFINLAFVGTKIFSVSRLEGKLKEEKVGLTKLEALRDSLMKKPAKKKISVGHYEVLLEKIENTPKWSMLLGELSRSLPNTVWLTRFKSMSIAEIIEAAKQATTAKDKKKDKKEESSKPVETGPTKYTLEISGLSSDMRNITEFTTKLSTSDYFNNLVLKKSDKESFGFAFTIHSSIKTGAR